MMATATRMAKINRLRLAKQQLCMCITLFCTLLMLHDYSMKLYLLDSWGKWTQDKNFLSFFDLRCSPLESITRKFAVIWKIEQNRKVHCECPNIILKWTLQWWKLHLTILSIVKVHHKEQFATTIFSTTQPCNVGSIQNNVATMLQHFVVEKIIIANRLV